MSRMRAEVLKLMAHAKHATTQGEYLSAKQILWSCLGICQMGMDLDPLGDWPQLHRQALLAYGLVFKEIDLEKALEVWTAIGRSRQQSLDIKASALRQQLEILCMLEKWRQAKELSITAQETLEDLRQIVQIDQAFRNLENEVQHFSGLAVRNDAKANKDAVDMDWIPEYALQWEKGQKEKETSQKMKDKQHPKKKKAKMKSVRRKSYAENEPRAKTDTPLLTSQQAIRETTSQGSFNDITGFSPSANARAFPGTSATNKSQKKQPKKRNKSVTKDGSENQRLQRLQKSNQASKSSRQTTKDHQISANVVSATKKDENTTETRYTFPLQDYNFILGCSLCSKEVGDKWEVSGNHSGCSENVLFVRRKVDSHSLWIKIRQRQSKMCYNTYKICRNFPDLPCGGSSRETCFFAHSEEEKKIWNDEKFHGFNIEAFKTQNKSCKEKAEFKQKEAKPVHEDISEHTAAFRRTYPGTFTFTKHVVIYTHKEIDFRIHKPTDATHKMELCSDTYCLESHCLYAHSEAERDFWLLAADTNLTIEALCKQLNKNSTHEVQLPLSLSSPLEKYYCNFCFRQCNGQKQFRDHCNSKPHMDKVTADDGDQWQHRQPPPGLQLKLCTEHIIGTCPYSNCYKAHSQDELEEWQQRIQIRRQKMRFAKQKGLLSYVTKIQQRLEECSLEGQLIKDHLDYVTIKCDEDLRLVRKEKGQEAAWTFQIFAKEKTLHNVALLQEKDRFWFDIEHQNGNNTQHLNEEEIKAHLVPSNQPGNSYQITVRFQGGVFGSFRQWLVLDFGRPPYLVKRLEVDVGEKIHEKMEVIRHSLEMNRWTAENVTIVPFEDTHGVARKKDDFSLKLAKKYKLKPGEISSSVMSESLSQDNYVTKMHDLLYIEETCQLQMISRFTSKITATISQCATTMRGNFINAPKGVKFAKLNLNSILSSEGQAGYLIQRNCDKVLLRPLKSNGKISSKAYEAPMVTKGTMFGQNAMGHDHVFVCVNENFLKATQVKDETDVEVWVQFEMNRARFCEMHFAVDVIKTNLLMLFPKSSRESQLDEFDIQTNILNEQQQLALMNILNHQEGYPMFILHGAFGTGKTKTLSSAAMHLVKNEAIEKRNKILICTLSNSAADLFVNLLDELNESEETKFKMVRVIQKDRHMKTISPKVQQYMLTEEDSFGNWHARLPTAKDIENSDVVITTVSTCLELVKLEVSGKFSHIFIDEAGQTFEPQLLMPLSLATKDTCIVLAGDVMQMSPTVYSPHAKQLKISLLQRIYERYQAEQKFSSDRKGPQRSVYLNENYRNDEMILKFLSTVIYGDADKLICRSGIRTNLASLKLHVVQGTEKPGTGTSFYNEEEVLEVGYLLSELLESSWPDNWGQKDLSKIAVTSMYADQVELIRNYLRLKGLGGVTVYPMENLQGLEYNVVVISTVHTSNPAENTNSEDLGFLSDAKLMNTAMSRAKHCVIVVGDAEALCTRGTNIFLWYTFLSLALARNGLVVQNHDPRVFVQSLETKIEAACITQAHHSEKLLKADGAMKKYNQDNETEDEADTEDTQSEYSETQSGEISTIDDATPYQSSVENPESCEDESVSDTRSLEDAEDDSDLILSAFREGKGEDMLLPILTDGGFVAENNLERITGIKVLRCLSYDQHQGTAKIELPSKHTSTKKRKTQWKPLDLKFQSMPVRTECHFESTALDYDEDDDNESLDEYDIIEREEMEISLQFDINCKRCQLHVRSYNNIKAVILDDDEMKGRTVMIKNRRYCKRALDEDEVAVQLRNFHGKIMEPLQGKVLGITRRNTNMRYRSFVCRADPTNSSLMIPISPKLPPFVCLKTKESNKKGYISIYKMEKGKKIIKTHNVRVENQQSKLYTVMYLKWTTRNSLPLGMVIGVLPVGSDWESGQKILTRSHNVPKRISESSKLHQNCELRFPQNYMEGKVFPDRLDLRNKRIFTVDNAESQDLDDALHIEENQDGSYTVGVHIADVSHFVKPDTDIDNEAYKRGTSYYPANEPPIHMLPRCLGTDLCSLLPEKDRLAVSVLFQMSPNGEVKSVSRHQTIIRSKQRFDYQEVEAILDDSNSHTDNWKLDIKKLYEFGQRFAIQHKGKRGYLSLEYEEAAPKARMMIEEWMVKTNKHIAEYLLQKLPEKVPLRSQIAPNQEEIDEWKKKYGDQIPFSFFLQRIASLLQDQETTPAPDGVVHIFRDSWEELNEYRKLDRIARSVSSFPDQICALKSWHRIQSRAMYHCSGAGADHLHFSLNSTAYTHFTSPIRRYIDIVVHRLLKADLENKPTDYTTSDISKICIHCTGTQMQEKDYESETNLLKSACDLKECPNKVFVVVKDVNPSEFEVIFPAIKFMPHNLRKVPFVQFILKEDPLNEDRRVKMTFERRIYHYGDTSRQPGDGAHLDSKQFTVAIQSNLWKQLVDAMEKGDEEMAIETFRQMRKQVVSRPSNPYLAREISSESAVQRKKRHQITFTRHMEINDVLQVQLATTIDKGIIKPCIQLIKLTPSFHICLEHARDPVNSFSTEQIPIDRGKDIAQYSKFWLSLLSMESAYSVIKTPGDQAHVHNVPIEWRKCNDGVVHGRLRMSRSFCKDRFLLFSPDVLFAFEKEDDGHKLNQKKDDGQNWIEKEHKRVQGVDCKNWQITKFGFMCVKFTIYVEDKELTWVGHFHITDVQIEKDVVVILKLNQSCYEFPAAALDKSDSDTPRCAIHWLDKPVPDVRAESAVLGLSDCTSESLPVLISLREIVPSTECLKSETNHMDTDLQECNKQQAHALRTALQTGNKFVLIWGPPGTGKSVTGARLAYLFAKKNEPRQQVMYCGPSNKSVNVVTAKLKVRPDLRVIRIFSEKLVNYHYPLPNFPQSKHVDNEMLDDHRDVALHELVRLEDRPFAEDIAKYDKRFREDPENVEPEDLMKYKELLKDAYREELAKADVVMCTCGSSGNGLYQKAFSEFVQQVIVDECGMCMEPETLIPIVACNPKKVVLIGDHKQLRPVINCPQAKDAGLDKTLFEEYADDAIMLQSQYRMHAMIQWFPSLKFYSGKLTCGQPDEQTKESRPFRNFWPAGPGCPIAFCHIEGEEHSQSVTTEIAGKNSSCNMAEVNHVIKVVHALIDGHVSQDKIAILTPYRLQLTKIKEKLHEHRLNDVTASTVITSQGSEWPYVILSTVRSLPLNEIEENPWNSWRRNNLGFLTDPHQVNVALTRAKNGLIIIGNRHLLRCDEVWADLLTFYESHGALTDCKSFP